MLAGSGREGAASWLAGEGGGSRRRCWQKGDWKEWLAGGGEMSGRGGGRRLRLTQQNGVLFEIVAVQFPRPAT